MRKTFDSVAWMRRRRTQIDEEDRGLSWKEKHRKTRKAIENDPLWQRLKARLIEPTSISEGAIGEHAGEYNKIKPD